MTRIVTTACRYKPPVRKRKPVALAVPVVVTRASQRREPAAPEPANADSPPAPAPAAKPMIATSISRKRTRLLSAEQATEPDDDPEATARVRAWLERAKWGHGPG